MPEMVETYYALVRQFVDLQQKLFQAFELELEIVPFPANFLDQFWEGKLKNIIKPEYSVSQILRAWPDDVSWLPLVAWAQPRVGVLQLEGQNWLFASHGLMDVEFTNLPPELDVTILESLTEGRMEALLGIPIKGPVIDTAYFEEGRTDGVLTRSVYVFAQSVDSIISDLSEEDHRYWLEQLVKEGLLIPVRDNVTYYIAGE
jgi:hypothetical protein